MEEISIRRYAAREGWDKKRHDAKLNAKEERAKLLAQQVNL